MQYICTGQVVAIIEPHSYDKEGINKKSSVVLTIKNENIKQRLEYILFDFMKEDVELIDDINLEVGNIVQINFSLNGRKGKDKNGADMYHQNLQAHSLKLL